MRMPRISAVRGIGCSDGVDRLTTPYACASSAVSKQTQFSKLLVGVSIATRSPDLLSQGSRTGAASLQSHVVPSAYRGLSRLDRLYELSRAHFLFHKRPPPHLSRQGPHFMSLESISPSVANLPTSRYLLGFRLLDTICFVVGAPSSRLDPSRG